VTLVCDGMPPGGRPCAVNSAATSSGSVSGRWNESGALSVPSLTTVSSIAPSLRRNTGTVSARTKPGGRAAAAVRPAMASSTRRRDKFLLLIAFSLLLPTAPAAEAALLHLGARARLGRDVE